MTPSRPALAPSPQGIVKAGGQVRNLPFAFASLIEILRRRNHGNKSRNFTELSQETLRLAPGLFLAPSRVLTIVRSVTRPPYRAARSPNPEPPLLTLPELISPAGSPTPSNRHPSLPGVMIAFSTPNSASPAGPATDKSADTQGPRGTSPRPAAGADPGHLLFQLRQGLSGLVLADKVR